MKAIIKTGDGGPEVLELGEVETPEPKPTQLLINIKATALNRADTLQRKGLYPPPAGESEILGLELAGIVEDRGSAVTGFERGDRIFGLVGGGGYAEYAIIDLMNWFGFLNSRISSNIPRNHLNIVSLSYVEGTPSL